MGYNHAPSLLPERIITYLISMKEEGLSYSYRNSALYAIKHYYSMNDVLLNWVKIAKFLGENIVTNDIRGYSHEEVQKLLTFADIKYNAVILCLASTGMRREALVQINPATDMTFLEDYKLYKIKIYRKTKYEQICFTTPEAAKAIKLHIDTRQRRYFHDVRPKAVSIHLRNLAIKAGLGQLHPDTETNRHGQFRDAIPAAHGLRKFAATQMGRSDMKVEAREILLGHSIGVRAAYQKYSDEDLLQEYVKAIDNLTINGEKRLQYEIDSLNNKLDIIEKLEKRLDELQAKVDG